ncbi:MAG: conjugal transfer protein TraF [Elusimicrobia bacterium]|nr:conjugal transfer protein TraF [Elusimicrobiota bacterium]
MFIRRSLSLALSLFLLTSYSHAESWKILGPRPMGMGGAFVAVAQGSIAQYWNPAGMAQEENTSGVQLPSGVHAEFTGGVLHNANTLGDLATKFNSVKADQETSGRINADQMAAVVQGIATIKDLNEGGKGALADLAFGANVKLGKMAFSVNNFTTIGASPFVDTTNIGLGTISGSGGVTFSGAPVGAPVDTASRDQIASAISTIGYGGLNNLICGSSTCINTQNGGITDATTLANALVNEAVSNGVSSTDIQAAAAAMAANASVAATVVAVLTSGNDNPYSNNQTNLTLNGGSFTEVTFGYARPVWLPGLNVGGNLKLISGSIGYQRFNVMQNEAGTTSALKDYNANTKTTVQPGLDIGVLQELDKILPALPMRPRFGLVFRNINNPKFTQPQTAKDNGESSKYSLNGQLRSGLAISPLNFWTIALDVDLTRNNTPVKGYHSRQVGLGTEINVFNRPWINIPLRVGFMKNVADSASKLSYTAGFGINFLHFMLDVAGSISSERTQIESDSKVPSNAALAAQLAFMF